MLAEHIMEHVAARLGLDPATVRERNFLAMPGAHARLICMLTGTPPYAPCITT
jgi:xanthine dehydrogenase molybdopterin-binding subunit B